MAARLLGGPSPGGTGESLLVPTLQTPISGPVPWSVLYRRLPWSGGSGLAQMPGVPDRPAAAWHKGGWPSTCLAPVMPPSPQEPRWARPDQRRRHRDSWRRLPSVGLSWPRLPDTTLESMKGQDGRLCPMPSAPVPVVGFILARTVIQGFCR